MVDGADADEWSLVAPEWRRLWGSLADPVRHELVHECRIGAGSSVVDVGCGSGEFLRVLADAGARAVGVDPAAAMVTLAREIGDAVAGSAERLPFDDDTFDAAVGVNALQFADDTTSALREMARVVRRGGRIGIANWAEDDRQDLTALERVVAAAHDEDLPPGGPLRQDGGIERAMTDAGLRPISSGVVGVPWAVPDDTGVVDGVLLGEDPDVAGDLAAVVLEAARPFRQPGGGYVLSNAFRWAVAEV